MRIWIGAALLLLAACGSPGHRVDTADEAVLLVHESLRGTPQVAGPFTATREGGVWVVRLPRQAGDPAAGESAFAVDARTGSISPYREATTTADPASGRK
ncbi:MAG: hypothetical protein GC203_18770 [Phenylobacterium sp.]|uniref:hypothetical protein n=1 Tax=Phenylobacterium sp. TaxID=1871053 RepID=UPI0025E24399|nr:hypothetical protein [Phenylobacterium sp.]MBI1199907.1 hypothetical protein [Phenylobacterium sp.]